VTTNAQPRYAIYFVPAADSDLYRFGSAMLGYDAYTGDDVPMPAELGLDPQTWRKLTDDPRRYGFHATLKAPFRLPEGRDEAQLAQVFFDFARRGHAAISIAPEIRLLGSFTAVVPREPSAELAALADRCTTEFDAFRAPTPAAERARRATGLTERQLGHLDRWGYPYVFADWRFHMTLTGRLPLDEQDVMLGVLCRRFACAYGEHSIAVDRLGLFKQADANARFRVLHHVEMGTL
jgi:putative phosphonate metabolism protein